MNIGDLLAEWNGKLGDVVSRLALESNGATKEELRARRDIVSMFVTLLSMPDIKANTIINVLQGVKSHFLKDKRNTYNSSGILVVDEIMKCIIDWSLGTRLRGKTQ